MIRRAPIHVYASFNAASGRCFMRSIDCLYAPLLCYNLPVN